MDENDLICKLKDGSEDAFKLIFKEHFSKLCLYAEHYVRDRQTAKEIVEDFFCHLWDNCSKITIESSLNAYFFTSIRNRCLKYLRHEEVKQKYLETRQYIFYDNELLEPASDDIAETRLLTEELQEKISLAINELPEQCRNVFMLSRFDDLSYAEISGKLGISINTVKTQMARALQKLRFSLRDYLVILLPLIMIFRI